MTDLEYLKKYYKGNINDAIKRLEKNEPVQYIVGNVDFYGYNIKVNKNVLIPRFETELLVEKTIELIKNNFFKKVSILDIGTGSGCIDIVLKKKLNSFITTVDISNEALEVAKENFKLNDTLINVIQSDILKNVTGKFDVIISNPPYIDYNEPIMDIVKNNEPSIALYALDNGLYFYKQILKQCKDYLNDKYLIAFEIGYKQAKDIIDLKNEYLKEANIKVEKDYNNKDRYIFIYKW